ncbi:lipopolysaccharide biosynthesis protein [Vibrio splendidus]|uniref:lipopolysaccharide biosynthesis protein n=1 Tax=Vibrio splendidus TaxID=29497 RepID=UPI000C8401C8|nr:oligosaccharide flippase family protein [Vibrio splendidus]PMH59725.1 lipopolysaccharide biosynthesis protein [Vibrio splendidus]PMJ53478.1 lipopolysaccharide biosynthesis protein [Vibrio splendidus]
MGSLKQSAYYAIGIVMMKGISLVMIPYITHKMTLVEYGSLEAIVLLADIGTILFSFGIVEAMYRYVGVAEGEEKRKLVSNCFTLSVLVCVLGGALIALSMPLLLLMLPVEFQPYQILLLLIPTMLDGAISIPLTLMRMNAMAKRFCMLNVMKASVQAAMTFALLEAGYGIDGVLISAAVSSVLLMLCLLRYQWQEMGSFGSLKDSAKILKFGLPTFVGGASIYMITGLDRWVMASFVGVEELAIYAVSGKFALLLGLLLQPYALWWFPNRVAMLQQPDGKKECADRALVGVNLAIVLGCLMILTVPGFITLILPSSYQYAGTIVVALLAIGVIKNAGDYLNLGCFSGDSSQSQMWIQGGCAILATIGYLVVTPIYGVWAVVVVLCGTYAVRLSLLYIVSQKMEYLPYDHRKWMAALSIAILAITSDRLLGWVLIDVHDFVLGSFVAIVTLVVFVRYSVIPVPQALLDKFTLGKQSHVS